MLAVSFDIDPTVSKIAGENMNLARYMRDQILTIDIYDADSRFLFATAKLPLFELLRQQHDTVVRAKEVEASAPDSAEFRCCLHVIMSNQGKQDKEQLREIGANANPGSIPLNNREVRGLQPSQQTGHRMQKYQKVVRSRPMDLTNVA